VFKVTPLKVVLCSCVFLEILLIQLPNMQITLSLMQLETSHLGKKKENEEEKRKEKEKEKEKKKEDSKLIFPSLLFFISLKRCYFFSGFFFGLTFL
jgi:hypothetical protein